MDATTAESLLSRAEETSARSRLAGGKAALDELQANDDALVSALEWFVDEARPDEALRLASALYRLWITKQRFEDGARWFGRALGAPDGDRRLRAQASIHAGFMPFWMGDDDGAAALFGSGLEIARDLGDGPLTSQALGGLARVALRVDAAEGRRLAREALDVSD